MTKPPDPPVQSSQPPCSPPQPTSVFICNFPFSYNRSDLEALFFGFGSIVRTFLPSICNKNGKRYGFVLFRYRKDASKAISGLHRSKIGSEQIIVDFSRGSIPKISDVEPITFKPSPIQQTSAPLSYKEVATRSFQAFSSTQNSPDTLSCSGSPNLHTPDLLRWSIIGVAKSCLSAEAICSSFPTARKFHVKLADLGNRAFLISFLDESSFVSSRSSNWSWLRKWFFEFFDGADLLVDGGCFRWVSISGIPLVGWTKDTITKLASFAGRVIVIHPLSTLLRRLDHAFVLVFSEARSGSILEIGIDLLVAGRSFKTYIQGLEAHLIPSVVLDNIPELTPDGLEEGEFLAPVSVLPEKPPVIAAGPVLPAEIASMSSSRGNDHGVRTGLDSTASSESEDQSPTKDMTQARGPDASIGSTHAPLAPPQSRYFPSPNADSNSNPLAGSFGSLGLGIETLMGLPDDPMHKDSDPSPLADPAPALVQGESHPHPDANGLSVSGLDHQIDPSMIKGRSFNFFISDLGSPSLDFSPVHLSSCRNKFKRNSKRRKKYGKLKSIQDAPICDNPKNAISLRPNAVDTWKILKSMGFRSKSSDDEVINFLHDKSSQPDSSLK